MTNTRKTVLFVSLVIATVAAMALYLYAQQHDDEHEALVANQVEVVKAARLIEAGHPLTRDRITTEKVPRKFLPPNPLLESELNIYLGTPLGRSVEEGAMVLTSDFTHSLVQSPVQGPTGYGAEGRLVVKNAAVTLQHDEPLQVIGELTSAAESHGGFVVSNSLQGEGDFAVATLKARVPAESFGEALAAIREQGKLVSEVVEGRDVSDKFVDLDAQLRNQKALEVRLLELLEESSTVENALEVEQQIAKVRTETDQLEGRVRHLRNQAALSTVEVTVQATPPRSKPQAEPGLFDPIVDAFGDAATTMIGMTAGIVRIAAAVVPFILLFGPLLYAAAALWRRRLRRAESGSDGGA